MEDFKKLSKSIGADCSGCMTVNTFETALHSRLNVPKKEEDVANIYRLML